MDGWNSGFLLGWPIFRGYVSFRECTCFFLRNFLEAFGHFRQHHLIFAVHVSASQLHHQASQLHHTKSNRCFPSNFWCWKVPSEGKLVHVELTMDLSFSNHLESYPSMAIIMVQDSKWHSHFYTWQKPPKQNHREIPRFGIIPIIPMAPQKNKTIHIHFPMKSYKVGLAKGPRLGTGWKKARISVTLRRWQGWKATDLPRSGSTVQICTD